MSDLSKISERHRRRRAVVYVRQSTPGQVERNTESAMRQYGLAERAVELGWPPESVVVVDEDTGRSAAWATSRMGFRELVAEVGLGHVGVILALEVSRLARSSADWHQLLDLCALTATLICDADGIYSPGEFNDRLLLGLKGTMSEAELHLIRARLRGGIENKARRGELRLNLPVGLERDADGEIRLTADEQVRAAIERVYALWRRCGSARQVVSALAGEQHRLPRRTVGEQRIRWEPASFGAVHDLLTNPAYAGAFVYGRTRHRKTVDPDGQIRGHVELLPISEWRVCLPGHHPGYVSWEQYLATQDRLRANARPRGEGGGAAREGSALLQGLVRCGKCGRRMMVAYSGTNGRTGRYLCSRTHQQQGTRRPCQAIGALRLDRAVATAFLDAVTPAGVDATASSIEALHAGHDERMHLQRLTVERRARSRSRSPPVRRLRTRTPARRPHPRSRARDRAQARRARTRQARRARASPPGALDRQRTRRPRAPRARSPAALEGPHHDRS
jgi:DNA invertase Pin-like site-specific DNA recombinase